MNLLLSLLAVLDLAAPPRDPAALLPEDFPVYVEVDAPSPLLDRLRKSAALQPLLERLPPEASQLLDGCAGLGVTRAAAGFAPSILSKLAFAVLLEAPDLDSLETRLRSLFGSGTLRIGRAGGYVLVTDSKSTAELVQDTEAGEEKALAARSDFLRFRKRVTGSDLRFHVDLERLLPIRPAEQDPEDAGAAFFAAHVLSIAASAGVVSGHVNLENGVRWSLQAEVSPLPESRRFATPPGPGPDLLEAPEGWAATLSFARDAAAFWKHREALVPEAARAGFAEFQNNMGLLLGGLHVEDLFAGLGSGFDTFLARLPKLDREPAHRLPMGALVAQVTSAKLRQELLLGFQEAIGFVNADNTQNGRPRFLLENRKHRDVTIVSARYPEDSLPEPDDDRLQLEPALAIAGERVIIGSHPAIVESLVDRAVDRRFRPREPGDVLRIDGPAAVRILEENAAALASRIVLTEGQPLEEARRTIAWLLDAARRVQSLLLRFRVDGELATFDLDLVAPGLWDAPTKGTGR